MIIILRTSGVIILMLATVYLSGPNPDNPVISAKLPSFSVNLENIADYVKRYDGVARIKPDNESRILWFNDSIYQ